MMGTSESSRRRRQTSWPSRSGSPRSSRTTSARSARRAPAALATRSTTYPSRVRPFASGSAMASSSSTSSTRICSRVPRGRSGWRVIWVKSPPSSADPPVGSSVGRGAAGPSAVTATGWRRSRATRSWDRGSDASCAASTDTAWCRRSRRRGPRGMGVQVEGDPLGVDVEGHGAHSARSQQGFGQAAGGERRAGHVHQRAVAGDPDPRSGHHGVGPEGVAPQLGVRVARAGIEAAVVDEQDEVLQDGLDVRGHRDVPAPEPEPDATVVVEHHRGRARSQRHGGAAVEVEAASRVLEAEPPVERGDGARRLRAAQVGRVHPAATRLACAGDELEAEPGRVDPRRGRDLARIGGIGAELGDVEPGSAIDRRSGRLPDAFAGQGRRDDERYRVRAGRGARASAGPSRPDRTVVGTGFRARGLPPARGAVFV